MGLCSVCCTACCKALCPLGRSGAVLSNFVVGRLAEDLYPGLQASEQIQQPFLALMLVCSSQQHESMWEQVNEWYIHHVAACCVQCI